MDNSKDLSPLAKGDIEIGKALPFAIFDRAGVLLLAEGQAVNSQKQLDELATKGLYHNPRWHTKFSIQSVKQQLDIAPLLRTLRFWLHTPCATENVYSQKKGRFGNFRPLTVFLCTDSAQ